MSIVYAPKPRYAVEVANTISKITGGRMQGAWDYRFGFHNLDDAVSAADRLAEEHEFVRVVDRNAETDETTLV